MDSFSRTGRDEVAVSVGSARVVGITEDVPAANPTKTGEPLEEFPSMKITLRKLGTLPVEDMRTGSCSAHASGSWPTAAVNS